MLRLILEVNGEVILRADPHIGLLHRGTEKLLEYKTFIQGLPYFDRLDYVSMMSQEHTYSLCLEHLLNIGVSLRPQYIRVIFCELTRILNHLMSVCTHAIDVGAFTPFLWGFEEREKLMEFYERVSGARMHAAFIRPGGTSKDVPIGLLSDILLFLDSFILKLNEIEELLTINRIWVQRLRGVGVINKANSKSYSLSGVLLRGSDSQWDLRKEQPYETYSSIPFLVPFGKSGDSYERYLLRIEEMKQSMLIAKRAIHLLPLGCVFNEKISIQKFQIEFSMESLIQHFKCFSEGFFIGSGERYMFTEAPKGEFGIYIVTFNSVRPYRCKIRAPGFFHLQVLNVLVKKLYISDVVTIIGSLDIVFGEVDR